MGTFEVIIETSMEKATQKAQSLYKDIKIKNLVIFTHGTESGGEIITKSHVDPVNGWITDESIHWKEAKQYHEGTSSTTEMESLGSILKMVEKDGSCLLGSCNAGKGKKGDALGFYFLKLILI
nr:hypothetical protein [Bacteroidota bacterium]